MFNEHETPEHSVSSTIVRMDAPHTLPGRNDAPTHLDRRRVRQVLAGASVVQRSRAVKGRLSDRELNFDPVVPDESDASHAGTSGSSVMDLFRQNLATLSHIANDSLLWQVDEGGMVGGVRESIALAATALKHAAWCGIDTSLSRKLDAGIVAIIGVLEQRIEHLIARLGALRTLRQATYRLSATLDGVTCGVVPAIEEIDHIVRLVTEMNGTDGEASITLIEPSSSELSVRVAAHSINVAVVAARLASSVWEWSSEIALPVSAALLQDAGMLSVPADIWTSATPLTPSQRIRMEHHSAASVAIIDRIRGHDERIVRGVLEHHERLDGSGYPSGLSGEAIGPLARLLAVADTYVGMQSPRPHRRPFRAHEALEAIAVEASLGRLDSAWAVRLPSVPPHWLRLGASLVPPPGAAAISALAA